MSHRALNWNVNELKKQERRFEEGLASKNESLDNELKAAVEATQRLRRVLLWFLRVRHQSRQECGTAETGALMVAREAQNGVAVQF